MLEATFSPLIPTQKSEEFYKVFYNQFSFIQINDVIITWMMENIKEEDKSNIINLLNDFNEDRNLAAIYNIGMGIMDEGIMRKREENRGISIEFFNYLRTNDIDPLTWYRQASEFLMIYSTCEQTIKEYLVSKGEDVFTIKENNILKKLFVKLKNNSLIDNYIEELKDGSSSIIKSQNELISIWEYYTVFRHCLAHSGGRTTDRIKQNMKEVLEKNKKELESISYAMLIKLFFKRDFFKSPFNDSIFVISDEHMNFFRNVVILIVESLERAINPDEYRIERFDPYKF